MYWCFLFLVTFLSEVLMLGGLRLEEVQIPEAGLFGGSMTLGCDFDLESDQLLSVKWYKDEHEFFSYSPKRSPLIQQHEVNGVFLQSNYTSNRITLVNLTLQAGGNYKCEVSAERPSYRTLSQDGNVTVIVPPDSESPRINGVPLAVRVGDMVNGNCTSFRSRPKAILTFFINDIKVNLTELIDYSPIVGTWERGGSLVELYTTVLGLGFKASGQHFRQGLIKVTCTSTIGQSLKPRSTEVIIKNQNFVETFTGIEYKQRSSSSGKNFCFQIKVLVVICLFTWEICSGKF